MANTNQSKPSSWMSRALAITVVLGVSVLLYREVLPRGLQALWFVPAKLRGEAPNCPWPRVASIYQDMSRFSGLHDTYKSAVVVKASDPTLDIDFIESPKRAFWIPQKGTSRSGKELLTYLLAEQDWLMDESSISVRKDDVVLDCGAHVGVFTSKALELGAAKVIAIEPNPVNVECLRRNFSSEIAARSRRRVSQGCVERGGKHSPCFLG